MTWRKGDYLSVEPSAIEGMARLQFQRGTEGGFLLFLPTTFVEQVVGWMRTGPLADGVDVIYAEALSLIERLAKGTRDVVALCEDSAP